MKARLPKGVGGGPGNMNAMLKQAQKMQEDMAALSAQLEEREYTASAGGVVTVTVTGKHRLQSIHIDPQAVDPEDTEMLEDMIAVAVNEAMQQADDTAEQEMGTLTGGMDLPGMF